MTACAPTKIITPVSAERQPAAVPVDIVHTFVDARRCVIAVSGEVDLHSALDLEWAIEQALLEGRDCVVLDLAETTFIDAAAVGAMADACRRIGRRPGALVVAGLTPEVRRVFRLTALDEVVPVFGTPDEALAAGPPPC